MKRTVEVTLELTPQEAAAIFSEGGEMWQAEFFNRLAEDVERRYAGGLAAFCLQMQYIVNSGQLTPEAKKVMSTIGEYGSDAP